VVPVWATDSKACTSARGRRHAAPHPAVALAGRRARVGTLREVPSWPT